VILFLTLAYCAVLAVLVKLKLVPWNLATKLSPIAWMMLLLFVLFIPMQFYAPGGAVVLLRNSVQIVPNVTGMVIEVPVKPNVPLKKGDVLFQIDPVPFEAAVKQTEAQLGLARLRLKQAQELEAVQAGSGYEVEQYEAQVRQLEGQLEGARWNLASTTVRAPADGFVTNVALREGARVAALPMSPAMAFIDTSDEALAAQIPQSYLRHVQPGMKGEAAFKYAPGKIFAVTVVAVLEASAQGLVAVGGIEVARQEVVLGPIFVRLSLDDAEAAKRLPAGAVGQVALYSDKGQPTHLIRKVMIRMTSWTNYIIPF
jgi:RND family efflux transporter MFP subunit